MNTDTLSADHRPTRTAVGTAQPEGLLGMGALQLCVEQEMRAGLGLAAEFAAQWVTVFRGSVLLVLFSWASHTAVCGHSISCSLPFKFILDTFSHSVLLNGFDREKSRRLSPNLFLCVCINTLIT